MNINWTELIECYYNATNEDQKVMYLNLIRELAAENKEFKDLAKRNGVKF